MNHFDPDMDLPDAGFSDDGQRRISRFTVSGVIGRGGMGEVLKAWDPEQQVIVALKVLNIDAREDPELRKRFEREAEAALTLDHPNIGKFYGAETDEQGHPVIVMEYIDGRPLDRVLKEDADLPFSLLADFVIQTARGLEYAFRRSIIHRDIKPSNLILSSHGTVKIIDFGLAKSLWDNSGLTASGMVVGTPRYISPEQGMGRSVDHRSDIYSLGATLYELVTHQTPFDGDTPLAIMMKHINTPLMPPYLINPKVPADMSEIIMRMMAKDPGERYQDYEPLIRDLESAKIHRMAKERRGGQPGDDRGMQTVMMDGMGNGGEEYDDEGMAAGGRTVGGGNRPSYLTEGLVDVQFHGVEEPASSPMKLIFLSLAGLIVIGIAVALALKPQDVNGVREPSWLAQRLSAMLTKGKSVAKRETAEDKVKADEESIRMTRARLEAVVNQVLQMRSAGQLTSVPTIRELRSKGLFTEEQTRDAWGNDFYITDGGGSAGQVVALGRDGTEKTGDDFRLALNGSEQVVPRALTVDEVSDKKKD